LCTLKFCVNLTMIIEFTNGTCNWPPLLIKEGGQNRKAASAKIDSRVVCVYLSACGWMGEWTLFTHMRLNECTLIFWIKCSDSYTRTHISKYTIIHVCARTYARIHKSTHTNTHAQSHKSRTRWYYLQCL